MNLITRKKFFHISLNTSFIFEKYPIEFSLWGVEGGGYRLPRGEANATGGSEWHGWFNSGKMWLGPNSGRSL